jgi:hypothetical protein
MRHEYMDYPWRMTFGAPQIILGGKISKLFDLPVAHHTVRDGYMDYLWQIMF